ncbi:hypothetical protein SCACP_15860 [Sporomusa carbonis]
MKKLKLLNVEYPEIVDWNEQKGTRFCCVPFYCRPYHCRPYYCHPYRLCRPFDCCYPQLDP